MIAISGVEVKQHYVTREGAAELQQLLNDLKRDRSVLVDEVRSLASQSGSVLDDPLQALNFSKAEEIDAQIIRLEHILAMVKIIDKPTLNQRVQLGSRVVIMIDGTEHTYTLLGSLEADPAQGKISNESPLGRVLLGKRVNDRIEVPLRGQHLTAVVTAIG